MELSTERIKRFWDKLGVVKSTVYEQGLGYIEVYPPVGLEQLFKHAVPVAIQELMKRLDIGEYVVWKELFNRWHKNMMDWSERPNSAMFIVEPAHTLFITIEEIMSPGGQSTSG